MKNSLGFAELSGYQDYIKKIFVYLIIYNIIYSYIKNKKGIYHG